MAWQSIRCGRIGGCCSPLGNRLSRKQLARLNRVLAADDPTGEIGAAWGCKELRRQLLAEHDPTRIRQALWHFYSACAEATETSRLATTVETVVAGHPRRAS